MLCKAMNRECEHVETRIVKRERRNNIPRQYCKLLKKTTTKRIDCPNCPERVQQNREIASSPSRVDREDISYLVSENIRLSRELKLEKRAKKAFQERLRKVETENVRLLGTVKTLSTQRDFLYQEREKVKATVSQRSASQSSLESK